MCIRDRDNGNKIEVAEDIQNENLMTIFISMNGGLSYNPEQSFSYCSPVSIIADPSNSSIQWMIHWVGYTTDSLYKSLDGGIIWNLVPYNTINVSSFVNGAPQIIAYDPSNSSIMYMGGDAWVAKSVNGGNTFKQLLNIVTAPYVIVVDPLNGSNVYVGGEQGVFVSHDGGVNWQSINNRSSSITQGIAVDGNNSIITLGNFNPIYSNDNGSSWNDLPRYANVIGVYRFEGGVVTVDPYNRSIVLFAAGQMEISHDGGQSYVLPQILQSGVDNPALSEMDAFVFVPNYSMMFYAGNMGIFESNDSGYTWYLLKNSPPNCSAIAGTIVEKKYVLYASNRSGLFYSDDYGLTWLKINDYNLETISIDPYNSSIIAATVSTKVMISYDGGKTFFMQINFQCKTPIPIYILV